MESFSGRLYNYCNVNSTCDVRIVWEEKKIISVKDFNIIKCNMVNVYLGSVKGLSGVCL